MAWINMEPNQAQIQKSLFEDCAQNLAAHALLQHTCRNTLRKHAYTW